MFAYIIFELKDLIIDIKKIIKKPKLILIWFVSLPFVFLSIVLIYIFGVLFYLLFLLKIINKILLRGWYQLLNKKRSIKPIKIEKEKIIIKNFFFRDIKNLIIRKAYKKAFLIIYLQILLLKDIKKNKKNAKEILIKMLEIILLYFFRKIILILTTLPYIVLKNNNKITLMLRTIFSIKADKNIEYLYVILLNLKIRYLSEINEKTKKKKIIFNKKEIKLNPFKKVYSEALEILNKFNEPKLYYDSLKIFSEEMVYLNAQLKFEDNKIVKFIKGHPTGILEKLENEEDKVVAINETTNEYLKHDTLLFKKLDIKSKPFFEQQTQKKIAYKTTVYEVDKELLKLKNNRQINEEFERPENKIKKLIFIQGFFLNLNKEMFCYDIKNKMMVDKNYINLQNYFEMNIDKFDDNKKNAIEKMLEFYVKNKSKFISEEENFLNLINKSTIDKETKEFFLNILNN